MSGSDTPIPRGSINLGGGVHHVSDYSRPYDAEAEGVRFAGAAATTSRVGTGPRGVRLGGAAATGGARSLATTPPLAGGVRGAGVGGVASEEDEEGEARLELRPVRGAPAAARVVLQPVQPSPPPKLSTAAGGTSIARKVPLRDRATMSATFSNIKRMLEGAYPQMRYLKINQTTLVFTIYDEHLNPTPIGFDEIRDTVSGGDPREKARIAHQLDEGIKDLRDISGNSGLDEHWPYSSRGQDARGNILGEDALQSHLAVVQEKHAEDLRYAVENEHCVPAIIAHVQPTKRERAARSILRMEAFHIKLRDNLKQRILHLDVQIAGQHNDARKKELSKQRQSLAKLLDQIENSCKQNRHALYYAAVFAEDSSLTTEKAKADACYEAVLRDLYDSAMSKIKDPAHRPGFDQFKASQEGIACKEYAADVAATLISDAADYKRFCLEHNVEPKQDHINVFLLQAFRSQPIQFNAISIGFDQRTKGILQQVLDDTTLWLVTAPVPTNFAILPGTDPVAGIKAKVGADLFTDASVSHTYYTRAQKAWARTFG